MFKSTKRLVLVAVSLLSLTTAGVHADPGEYNPGPDPTTKMGRWLLDLYANLPEYFALSDELMDQQKFRYVFGTMMTRTYFTPNAVKILAIGQDATGIAEAGKQPGISGFGGRVQSIARHFGVDQGLATTNAYLSTINGQYGAFEHLYVQADENGKPVIHKTKYVDNELWAITHNPDSEIRISREKFWEWMLMNNEDSMDMMMFFGDAAKDSFAQFLMARGFDVPMKKIVRKGVDESITPELLKKIQVPETVLKNAGGNAEFPVPVTKKNEDVYAILLREKYGESAPYFKKDRFGSGMVPDYSNAAVRNEAVKLLSDSGQRGIDMMVFTGGGINGSGIADLGQIAEYDFDNITFNGEKVRSMKGMKLKYFDHTISRDIAFIESVHPTMLSKMTNEEASKAVNRIFAPLHDLVKRGWSIRPDKDDLGRLLDNRWALGKDYFYNKEDIRAGYTEQGAPPNRRTASADFSRMDRQVIIASTREKAKFDKNKLDAAKKSQPATAKDPNDLFSVRPRGAESRYVFDRGPGEEISKLMADNLDLEAIFTPKPGMKVVNNSGRDITFDTHGIAAYNTKSIPESGYFGTHRGNFQTAKALILADPHGVDDWNSSRALTGARGQYLHGLMGDLGFGDDYLVLKTAPFAMDGATPEEWEVVRKQTEKYREAIIAKALENKDIEMIFVDGPIAKVEMDRILKKMGVTHLSVVNVARTELANPAEGMIEAGETASRLLKGRTAGKITGRHADIPTSHLTWWSRLWEGTGGVDLTIDSEDVTVKGKTKYFKGKAYAIITPDWVAKQDVNLLQSTKLSIRRIRQFLNRMMVRIGAEPLSKWMNGHSGSWQEIENNRRAFFAGGSALTPVLSYEDCVALLKKSAKRK